MTTITQTNGIQAIRTFYQEASRIQEKCSEQIKELLKKLQECNEHSFGKEKEHIDLLIHLSKQMSNNYSDTAKQLMELEAMNTEAQLGQIRGYLDLNFFLRDKQFDEIKGEMALIQGENERLRQQTARLLQQSQQQVLDYADDIKKVILPIWRYTKRGVNVEGICTNSDCRAVKQRVIMTVGEGTHQMANLIFKATCPLCNKPISEVDRLVLERCAYSLAAKTRDRQEIKTTGEVGRDPLFLDMQDWMIAQITIKYN